MIMFLHMQLLLNGVYHFKNSQLSCCVDFDSGMTLPTTRATAPLLPLSNPNREPNRNPSHKAKPLKPAVLKKTKTVQTLSPKR